MKKVFLLICVIAVFILTVRQPVYALSASSVLSFFKSPETDIIGHAGLTLDIWQCNNDDHGSQFVIPIQGDIKSNTFSFSLVTAYVNTSFSPDEGGTKSLSSILDTKLNFSYSILDRLPVDMMLGLDLNIPTGKTSLDDDEVALIMDSDLVSINTFGEGFNINPTLSFIKTWDQWTGSMGLGYVFRGEYDFSNALVNYNPGDIYNITTKIDYRYSSIVTVSGLVEYAFYDIDQAESADYYQEGNFLLLGLILNYIKPAWDASLSLYDVLRGKSKFLDGDVLLTEDRKSNGDEWVLGLSFGYVLNPEITLSSQLQLTQVSENDYPTDSVYYESKRQKAVLGCGITKSNLYFSSLEGQLFIKGFILDVDKAWPEVDENLSYTGFSVAGTITHMF